MAQQKKAKTGSPVKKTAKMPQYRQYPPQPEGPPEVVEPMWLVKAIGVAIVAAAVCAYGALCLLMYQGAWQLILHPKRGMAAPAQIDGTAVQSVKFGTDASGTPQLTGWSIPAPSGGAYAGMTVLYLPSGDGSLADAVPTLALLHHLGIGIFAMDYRGYGQSVNVHPNQQRMMQDAESGYTYLTTSRTLPESTIVPYGAGLGGSLAVALAAKHPGLKSVIVEAPGQDPLAIVEADPRTKLLPVHLLLRDRFPLAEPLATLKTPKLLLTPDARDSRFSGAANPKIVVYGLAAHNTMQYGITMREYLQRFLDESMMSAHAPSNREAK